MPGSSPGGGKALTFGLEKLVAANGYKARGDTPEAVAARAAVQTNGEGPAYEPDLVGPEETALILAVLAEPFADAPRLAFARWTEENGNSKRAQQIRRQIRTGETEPWTFRLDDRITGVLRRGCPDELHIPAELFTPSAARLLFASYPFTAVQFTDRATDAALSRAAVGFGRELAGLPPLTWPERD
jgi:uncharacterized protein (TIGR02996 family)